MIVDINSLKDIPLDKMVIIKFYASWCKPCNECSIYFKNVSNRYKDSGIIFMQNDIKTRELADYFNIKSLPTMIYIKNGEIVYTIEGTSVTDIVMNTKSLITYTTSTSTNSKIIP